MCMMMHGVAMYVDACIGDNRNIVACRARKKAARHTFITHAPPVYILETLLCISVSPGQTHVRSV